jgi:hypothetical protein
MMAGVEALLAAAAVLLDLALPSLVIVALAGVSLAVRRQPPSALGFHRPRRPHLLAGTAAFALLWSFVQLAVTIPVVTHLSGRNQDMGVFADVEGNVAMLALLVVLSWTLAALVEETAFRGYLLTRLRDVLGQGRVATIVAVVASSLLFGLMHGEQGPVGVVAVAIDAMAFCALRFYYGTVWAAVLGHGFSNTLGLVTFFLVGPQYGLW